MVQNHSESALWRKWVISLAMVTLLVLAGATAQAESFGVNFVGGGSAMSTTSTAGVVSQQFWNNGYSTAGNGSLSSGTIVDDSGTTLSTVEVSYDFGTQWLAANNATSYPLYNGYIDANTVGGEYTVTLSGIPYEQYEIYVYVGSDGDGRKGSVKIAGEETEFFFATSSANFSEHIISTDTTGAYAPANTVKFYRVMGADTQLVFTQRGSNCGIHGIQVVESNKTPEVATDTKSVEFGQAISNTGVVTKALAVWNFGFPGQVLDINSIDTTQLGGVTVESIVKTAGDQPVGPDYTTSLDQGGASLIVTLGLDTSADGAVDGKLVINSNDPLMPALEIPVSGLVAPVSTLAVTNGLVAHFDAASLVGTVADGGEVNLWEDLSANDYDVFTSGTQGSAPTFVNNVLNRHPVVRFSSNNLYRNDSMGFVGNPASTVIVVLKNSASVGRFMQFGAATDNAGKSVAYTCDAGFRYNNGNALFSESLKGADFNVGVFRTADGATYGEREFNKNGNWTTRVSSTNPGTLMDIPSTVSITLDTRIGSGLNGTGSPSEYLAGDIAEIIIYDRTLADYEVQELGHYLTAKYALTTNFVEDGPQIGLSTDSVEFPTVSPGEAVTTYTVEVKNVAYSGDALEITSIELSNTVNFGMKILKDGVELTSFPISLAKISTETLEVLVTVDTTTEMFMDEMIQINSNDPSDTTATISLRARVAGIAQPPITRGMLLHLDAGNIHGLTTGDSVTNWFDSSAYQNDAVQSNVAKAPLYYAKGTTGQPIVRFDGLGDYVGFTNVSGIQTAFVVMLETDRNASSNRWRSILGSDEPYFHRGTGNNILSAQYGDKTALNGSTWVDGVKVDPAVTESPIDLGIITFVPAGEVQVNQLARDRTYTNRGVSGDFAEVIFYDRALTDSELNLIGTYLTHKWGVVSSSYTQPTPAPDIEVDTSEINYGMKAIGSREVTKVITINNFGYAMPLEVTSVVSSNPAFTISCVLNGVEVAAPVVVNGTDDTLEVSVTFKSQITGRYDSVLTITSNDPDSGVITVPVLASASDEWLSTDIGAVAAAGYANYTRDGQGIEFTASGADIYGSADEMHYVYKKLTGDGTITARVTNLDPISVNTWIKAGVMIRNNISAGSPHMMAISSAGNGALYQWRPTQSGTSIALDGSLRNKFPQPYWVRVEREGTTLTASISPDGVTWDTLTNPAVGSNGSQNIDLDEDVLVGLALTSHADGSLVTATIDNITVTGNVSNAPQSKDVYVDANAMGANNGTTWDDAITTNVQAAINMVADNADGGTVFVAEGIYMLTNQLNMKSNVNVVGLGATKPVFMQTASNKRVVEFNGTQNATLVGVVLSGGNLTGTDNTTDAGAGVRFVNADATNMLVNCDVVNNTVNRYGAGVSFHTNSMAVVSGCRIVGNAKTTSGDYAAAIYANSNSAPVLENNVISGNTGKVGLMAFDSGAINTVSITNNTIDSNEMIGDSLIHMISGSALLTNNIISNNTFTTTTFTGSSKSVIARDTTLLFGNTGSVLGGVVTGGADITADPMFTAISTGTITTIVSGATSTVLTIDGATFAVNALVGAVVNPSTTQSLQTIILSNTADTITVLGDGNGTTIGLTVEFINYTVTTASPAIDAGVASDLVLAFDANGYSRPGAAALDLGAYEIADDFNVTALTDLIDAGVANVAGAAVQASFSLKNTGLAQVYWRAMLSGVDSDQFSTSAGGTLAVGAVASAAVSFDPTTIGQKNAVLTVSLYENETTTATVGNVVTIPVTGLAVADVELTLPTPSNGSIIAFPEGPYVMPSDVTLTAVPDEGYDFTGWTGATLSTTSLMTTPLVVSLTTNTTVEATFTIRSYEVAVVTGDNGAAVIAPVQASYDHFTPITLTATPDANYHFAGWTGDKVPADMEMTNPLEVTVDAATTFTASFAIDTFTLAVIAENGSVTTSPNQPDYAYGTTVTLTETADNGYAFAGWSGEAIPAGEEMATSITVLMDADTTVTATFEMLSFSVNVVQTANGTIATTPTQTDYTFGTELVFTATPDANYSVASWVIDGQTVADATGTTLALTVSAETTISATFAIDTFALNIVAENGTTTRTPVLTAYPYGSTVTLVAIPADTYHFTGWIVEGIPTTATQSTTLTLLIEGETTATATFAIDTYMLNVVADNGAIAATPALTAYDHGSIVALTATPDMGYTFVKWLGDDVTTATETATTLTVVMDADTTVTALFAATGYMLDVTAENGSTTISLVQDVYAFGTTVTVIATPDEHYHQVGWMVNDTLTTEGIASSITLVMTEDLSVEALFAINSSVLTVDAVNGTVDVSPMQAAYDFGTTVVLTATPDENYYFAGWNVDASLASSITIVMDNDKHVVATFATFAVTTYTLNTVAQNGTIATTPSLAAYDQGTTVSVTAVPAENYFFTGWTIEGQPTTQSLDATISVVMNNETTVTATFDIFTYALNVIAENGTVVTTPELDIYEHGTTVTLVATPDVNYHFVAWNTGETATSLTVIMTEATTVTASFAIDTFAVTVNAVDGSVSLSPEAAEYAFGTTVTLTATPAANFHFTGWTGDVAAGSEMTNPITITVDSAKTLTATFTVDTLTLTVDATNGTVAKSPEAAQYAFGTSVELTATPAANYHFTGWIGDVAAGSEMTNPLTITVDAAKALEATFAIDTYSITASAQDGGTVAVSPDQTAFDFGTEVTVTATPAEGFRFLGWTGDVPADSELTNPLTVMVEGNVVLYATFEALPASANYKITWSKATMEMDEDNNIVLTNVSEKSSLKIAYLKKLPKKLTEKEGTKYALDLRVVPTITINGNFGKVFTDVPVRSLISVGSIKSITTKLAPINSVEALSVGSIKMGALVNAWQGEVAETAIVLTGGAAEKAFSASFTGVILTGLDSAQSVKNLKVASKAFKTVEKVKTYSLSGIGSAEQVQMVGSGSVSMLSEDISVVIAPAIKTISAKGASIIPTLLQGALNTITVKSGSFRVAEGMAIVESNLVAGSVVSSTLMKSITAKAKKVDGVMFGGNIGMIGDTTATAIMVNGDIKTITAQNLSAIILAGFSDADPTFTGTIKKIKVLGTIAGEAYVATEIKFSPKSLDTTNFEVIIPQG